MVFIRQLEAIGFIRLIAKSANQEAQFDILKWKSNWEGILRW